MKNIFLLLSILLSLICLESCTTPTRNAEVIKLLAQKMNTGDTIGIRSIFTDSVKYYFADSFTNTSSVNTEINNILTSRIYNGFYQIDRIVESKGDSVQFITNEFPGYLMESISEVDTLNYLMTYYFRNGKIYKTRTDTLKNVDYSYASLSEQQNANLMEFFGWLNKNHPAIDSALNMYYSDLTAGALQSSEVVLASEKLQKKYFMMWEEEIARTKRLN